MKLNGTLINYYFHCKRQCYLFGNRLNLEDTSEIVQIGRAIHEEKNTNDNSEISIENIKLDKLTDEYLTEIKKSDADIQAASWQILLYLKILKDKGIIRKGKLEFVETNKQLQKTIIIELTPPLEEQLKTVEIQIGELLQKDDVPAIINDKRCPKCAYFEYCYI